MTREVDRNSSMPTGAVRTKDDDPFALIERGNALDSSGNLWGAADSYGMAAVVLRRQSDNLITELGGSASAPPVLTPKDMEQWKVADLYREKSREYLYKARESLMKALSFENHEDRKRAEAMAGVARSSKRGIMEQMDAALLKQLDPLTMMISVEESKRRTRIFNRIYALNTVEEKEDAVNCVEEKEEAAEETSQTPGKEEKKVNENIDKKQHSLEDRLAELESTLPPPSNEYKSEAQRLAEIDKGMRRLGMKLPSEDTPLDAKRLSDIDKGLRRLGLSLPPQHDNQSLLSPSAEANQPSAEEQVELIMEQAKDEAKLEGKDETMTDNIEVNPDGTVHEDVPVVRDGEGLSDILVKAGMGADVKDLTEGVTESEKEMMASARAVLNEGGTLGDTSALLQLISRTENLLLDASAHIEDHLDGNGDESDLEDLEESGMVGGESSGKVNVPKGSGMEKGKQKLLEAQKCLEKAIKSMP